MGSMQKRKGKIGEREAAAELGMLLGCHARRGVQYHGGPDSPDVVIDANLHIEAKRVEKLSLYDAVDQAVGDAPTGAVPVVWHRRNRRESVLVIRTADAVAFAREVVRVAGGGQKLR